MMKNRYIIWLFICNIFFCCCGQEAIAEESLLKLTSLAFEHNQIIPRKYTCQGEDVNPPLKISGVPERAKNLVLIVDDPDAPMGTWVHWTVWNIPLNTRIIGENVGTIALEGVWVEGLTSFGRSGYGGPCPPSGTHRYFFKIFALDTALNLDQRASPQTLEKAMRGHIIEKAELMGLYKKE